MKRFNQVLAWLLLVPTLTLSSCIGQFKLTNVMYEWNMTMSRKKWVNALVFIPMTVVYALTLVVDGLVLNSIQFWKEGDVFTLQEGEQRQLLVNKGNREVLITATRHQYHILDTKGPNTGEWAKLTFCEEEEQWYLETCTSLTPL